MRASLIRQVKFVKKVIPIENKRNLLRSCYSTLSLPFIQRIYSAKRLRTLAQKGPSKIRYLCIFSGRGRSVIYQFRLSRIFLRRYAASGLIPGVTKSSW